MRSIGSGRAVLRPVPATLHSVLLFCSRRFTATPLAPVAESSRRPFSVHRPCMICMAVGRPNATRNWSLHATRYMHRCDHSISMGIHVHCPPPALPIPQIARGWTTAGGRSALVGLASAAADVFDSISTVAIAAPRRERFRIHKYVGARLCVSTAHGQLRVTGEAVRTLRPYAAVIRYISRVQYLLMYAQ